MQRSCRFRKQLSILAKKGRDEVRAAEVCINLEERVYTHTRAYKGDQGAAPSGSGVCKLGEVALPRLLKGAQG